MSANDGGQFILRDKLTRGGVAVDVGTASRRVRHKHLCRHRVTLFFIHGVTSEQIPHRTRRGWFTEAVNRVDVVQVNNLRGDAPVHTHEAILPQTKQR